MLHVGKQEEEESGPQRQQNEEGKKNENDIDKLLEQFEDQIGDKAKSAEPDNSPREEPKSVLSQAKSNKKELD